MTIPQKKQFVPYRSQVNLAYAALYLCQDLMPTHDVELPGELVPELTWKRHTGGRSKRGDYPEEWSTKGMPHWTVMYESRFTLDRIMANVWLMYAPKVDEHYTSVSIWFQEFMPHVSRSYYMDGDAVDVGKADVERIITAHVAYMYAEYVRVRPRMRTLDIPRGG